MLILSVEVCVVISDLEKNTCSPDAYVLSVSVLYGDIFTTVSRQSLFSLLICTYMIGWNVAHR